MMRGTVIGRQLPNSNSFSKQILIPFSTSSGGRGRGGGNAPKFDFIAPSPGKTDSDDYKHSSLESPEPQIPRPGLGYGRGRPLPSSFSAFVSAIGRGRGVGSTDEAAAEFAEKPTSETARALPVGESPLPDDIISVLPGSGRGKPAGPPALEASAAEENRHIRRRNRPSVANAPADPTPRRRLSQVEATGRAIQILSRDSEAYAKRGGGRGRGRGGQFRGRGEGRGQVEDEEDFGDAAFLGDNADGEKLAAKVGPEIMNKLTEGFEEVCGEVLPSPLDDAFLDAFHTNCMIEFEPEYSVEFNNPDIDEKPSISLREALEKAKPFLMKYEGIGSQEEWEEAVDEVMKRVPLLKEIVDYYSGPDRVTAKQQHEELERVAKSIPKSAPASVKQFADRAVLSLQSNPGWGWDKKCQFMDKLVREVTQHYP